MLGRIDKGVNRRGVRRISFAALNAALIVLSLLIVPMTSEGMAVERANTSAKLILIPQVNQPPVLEDFLDIHSSERTDQLARVEGFIQRKPKDGAPTTQRTVVYLGYDHSNLYAIFLCYDTKPSQIRARMVNREQIDDSDDYVSLQLDTFHDQRRAYGFTANPNGIQQDAIWTEGQGWDLSFDTVWHTDGRLTNEGYVVWMAIPFRSLRFSLAQQQNWGILLNRHIPHLNECTFWPEFSMRIEGRLNQAGTLSGLKNISPDRNMQVIPYLFTRSYRVLDQHDPIHPRFESSSLAIDGGLDTKIVFKDCLVLDLTVNPDFSQVESDEPQVTVNQRFEVFFPEKRPFFLENSNYFLTPFNLVFTRRIADPQFGMRLTGKLGSYGLGILFTDDQAPGKSTSSGGSLEGDRAYSSVVRLSRDIHHQSSVGFLFTDRELHGGFNRVFGLDARIKLGSTWVATAQAFRSLTRQLDGSRLAGFGYYADLRHIGEHFIYSFRYSDLADGFRSQLGFIERTDIRNLSQSAEYYFRPANKYLDAWGPKITSELIWNHTGTRLMHRFEPSIIWNFHCQTSFGIYYCRLDETIDPRDFPSLNNNKNIFQQGKGLYLQSSFANWISFDSKYWWGTGVNYVPVTGSEPEAARSQNAKIILTFFPIKPLRIETIFLSQQLDSLKSEHIFTNQILRLSWKYQINRKLSLRFIAQYNTVDANSKQTSLQTIKNFNVDFLIIYLIYPGTAIWIGYNSNLQNIDPALLPDSSGLRRTDHSLMNDGRQLFIKVSYLLRF